MNMLRCFLVAVLFLFTLAPQSALADCTATFANGKATVEGCKTGDKLVMRAFDSGLLVEAEHRLCTEEGNERPTKDKSGIAERFVLECRYIGWLQEKPSEGVLVTGRGVYRFSPR